jgi:4-hydroxy-tetrahydrodipicolinate synthase
MNGPILTNAICTPLNPDESLHVEGLKAHLDAQWQMGAHGVLVGGTMGLMQLLRADTYRELIRESVAAARNRGEILVGIGDTSLARTRERLHVCEEFNPDGVVVVTPYFYKFARQDLIDYFKVLADESKKPLFVYYLPGLTGVTFDFETALELSRHPNIRGIKCSCDYAWAQQLRYETPSDFRVIVAQPTLLAPLFRAGVQEHLDGIFAVLPGLTAHLLHACTAGNWEEADKKQILLSRVLRLIVGSYPLFPACEALLNEQGVPGQFSPAPIRRLSAEQKQKLLAEPVIREALACSL